VCRLSVYIHDDLFLSFFLFIGTATTDIYTLSLHDALPISYFAKCWYVNTRKSIGTGKEVPVPPQLDWDLWQGPAPRRPYKDNVRSEEHTSELQSLAYLVCRLLLEKKNNLKARSSCPLLRSS